MHYPIVFYTLGVMISILGLAQMIPAAFDWQNHPATAQVFLFNGLICLFFGGAFVLANRECRDSIGAREAFLMAVLGWAITAAFAALPLYLADLNISYAGAYFEAMAGITTSAGTVLRGLDSLSPGILIWRSMLQGLGGIAIVAFAVLLLPFLGAGGMQLFQSEPSGRASKLMARSRQFIGSLAMVYGLLLLLCAGVYWALGMSAFDALNHALTTISTGGHSTHDTSFGYFRNPALEYAAVFFMILGACPFIMFVRALYRHQYSILGDAQVKDFLLLLCGLLLILGLWLWTARLYTLEDTFRRSLFHLVSALTTTGFTSVNYLLWGPFAGAFFLLLAHIGGCAGSTAGGIKILRLSIAAKILVQHIKMHLYPHGVFAIRHQDRSLDNDIIFTVLGFLSLYVLCNIALTCALSLTGLDFQTALSAAAAAIGNGGPGIGPLIGPAGSHASLADAPLWLLSAGMLLGRLEILTVVVLLSPRFWKK